MGRRPGVRWVRLLGLPLRLGRTAGAGTGRGNAEAERDAEAARGEGIQRRAERGAAEAGCGGRLRGGRRG